MGCVGLVFSKYAGMVRSLGPAPTPQAGFIKTPFFMFNSRFDAWQLANINQAGWTTPSERAAVLQYGGDFLSEWQPAVPPGGR